MHRRPGAGAGIDAGGYGEMTDHGVVIAGAGPAGMMLAGELALAGVDVGIFERRSDHVLAGSRAGGFHARTLEVLDQRGVVDRFLAEGRPAQAVMVASSVLDMSDFPTRHPYSLGIWQNRIERIMAAWVAELGVVVHYGREVTGVAQDAGGVAVRLADGSTVGTGYLVGCDGGRSLVRRAAGIDFPGWDPTCSSLIGEVELTGDPPPGMRNDPRGVSGLHLMEDGRTFRVVVAEQQLPADGAEPSLEDLKGALVEVFGTDFGAHNPTWISRFTDMTRQAASYREGRVLLAGDAAHVQFPAGGQGLSLGLQDAVNLGWKLAQVAGGTCGDTLLETYHAERHPVGARALQYSMALGILQRRDGRTDALARMVSELATLDGPRRHLAGAISGLDIRYDLGDGHPLVGRRIPDLDLRTSDGTLRLYELLHQACPLLLTFDGSTPPAIPGWDDRVRSLTATYRGTWELPVIGAVPAPASAFVRPDGYVAWTGGHGGEGHRTGRAEETLRGDPALGGDPPLRCDPALREALTTWLGPPR